MLMAIFVKERKKKKRKECISEGAKGPDAVADEMVTFFLRQGKDRAEASCVGSSRTLAKEVAAFALLQ